MLQFLLTAVVLWSLMQGSLPGPWTLALSILPALFLTVIARHDHDHSNLTAMDYLARRSRLYRWNPGVKVGFGCVMLVLAVASPTPLPPMGILLVMALLVVAAGGLSLGHYVKTLTLPGMFLLISALALLWSYAKEPTGLANIPFFGGYLTIHPEDLSRGKLVLARAVGGVSCLSFISLTTPIPEVVRVLRRCHVPAILTELAVLIYRYIFILLETHHQMHASAAGRLGYTGLKTSLRTTGMVYAGLLGQSFRKANACFDAMESRCYEGELLFLEEDKPVTAGVAAAALSLFLLALLWVVFAVRR